MTASAQLAAWRRTPVLVPLLLGAGGVLAGGFVAAASAPVASEKASWAAAYLVLVVGVAQLALAAGAAWLTEREPSARLLGWEFSAWNAGNAAVLAGTLSGVQVVVDIGGALIVAALIAALVVVRDARAGGWLLAYRIVVVVVAVSVPVGLVLGRVGG